MTTLHDLFAATAGRFPEEVALDVAGETFTYRDLDGLSAGLAARILDRMGRPPARIGLSDTRSVSTFVGYLAIQRLGATAVPLNPDFPWRHNTSIITTATVDLVLADDAAPGDGAPVMSVDNTTASAGAVVGAPPCQDRPAYLLFTSGSTGNPKGVPITHANVTAFLKHVRSRYRIGPGCRVSHNFRLTFDLSVFDLYGSWGSGAALVVPSPRDQLSPVGYVNRAGITHWLSVPSVIAVAARRGALRPAAMPGLRWSLFCGEPLIESRAAEWQAAAPESVLENLYGPTETTVACMQHRFTGPATGQGTVPIGVPYPRVEVLVLDDAGRAADTGELCVRGPQRFGGYLAPEQNAGRFVAYNGSGTATVHNGPPTDRHWYRTGDRVTRASSGYTFVGRVDDQVKINGFRIELGDVEAHLRLQPGVEDAVAVVVEDRDGDPVLHAAVVGAEVVVPDIMARMRQEVAPYLVPELTPVSELPRNANGKTDRAAVAAMVLEAR